MTTSTAIVIKATQKSHATLGASSAARWWSCPGSVALSEAVGENYESAAAKEGTAAHALAELRLRGDTSKIEFLDGVPVIAEMEEYVNVFIDYCRRLMTFSDRYGIEEQFNLAALNPPTEMFGTADFWAYNDETKVLEIVDLKYGMGVVVEVADNKQLLYYALGAVLKANIFPDTVLVTIIQPRAGHADGQIRSFEIDILDLVGFAGELMEHARATMEPNAPRIPGAHCKWCPAAGKCPEQANAAMAVAQVEFGVPGVLSIPDPATIPEPILFDVLPNIHLLEDFLSAIKQRGEALMRSGVDIPGMKMVERRARRRWVDELALINDLGTKGYAPNELYEHSLKSVAQIEKLIGKKNLPPELVERISTGFKMVRASDPSPGVAMLSAVDDFALLPASDGEE